LKLSLKERYDLVKLEREKAVQRLRACQKYTKAPLVVKSFIEDHLRDLFNTYRIESDRSTDEYLRVGITNLLPLPGSANVLKYESFEDYLELSRSGRFNYLHVPDPREGLVVAEDLLKGNGELLWDMIDLVTARFPVSPRLVAGDYTEAEGLSFEQREIMAARNTFSTFATWMIEKRLSTLPTSSSLPESSPAAQQLHPSDDSDSILKISAVLSERGRARWQANVLYTIDNDDKTMPLKPKRPHSKHTSLKQFWICLLPTMQSSARDGGDNYRRQQVLDVLPAKEKQRLAVGLPTKLRLQQQREKRAEEDKRKALETPPASDDEDDDDEPRLGCCTCIW